MEGVRWNVEGGMCQMEGVDGRLKVEYGRWKMWGYRVQELKNKTQRSRMRQSLFKSIIRILNVIRWEAATTETSQLCVKCSTSVVMTVTEV